MTTEYKSLDEIIHDLKEMAVKWDAPSAWQLLEVITDLAEAMRYGK